MQVATLPTPTPDPSMPTAALDRFEDNPPTHAIFEDSLSTYFLPPVVRGSFGLHNGLNPSQPGATVDIVPRNIELCIDTIQANDLNLCDSSISGQRIPIYAPTGGCAIYQDIEDNPDTPNVNENQPPTISIRIDHTDDCEANVTNDDRFITLSHLVDSQVPSGNRVLVSAGDLLGYMCLSNEAFTGSCEVNTATTPTHVAFQTQ